MKKIILIMGTILAFVSINAIADPNNIAVNANSGSESFAATSSEAYSAQQQANSNIGNDHSSTVYQARDIPVATAYAPALTTSNDTCMGSTSVGAQGLLFGVSFGTTWTDNDCITRKDARFVHNAGHRIVALSLMCGKEAMRAAVARAGTPEQLAACSITEMEIKEYREKPIIVTVKREAPSFDDE